MAETSGLNNKKIQMKTSDNEIFEVDVAIASEWGTIKRMIGEDCQASVFPVANVSSSILTMVIEYTKKHVEAAARDPMTIPNNVGVPVDVDDALVKWDKEFARVDHDTLFDLMMAANYLDIKDLLDLTCQTVADLIVGKTPEEIRAYFHIKNDYTPEEEAQVRRENAWAFD